MHFERVPGLLLGGFRAQKTTRKPCRFSLLFSSPPGFVSGGPSDRFGATFRRFLEPRSKRPDPCFDWPLPVRSRVRASAGGSEGRARTTRKRSRILRGFSTRSGLVLGRPRTPFRLTFRVRISLKTRPKIHRFFDRISTLPGHDFGSRGRTGFASEILSNFG